MADRRRKRIRTLAITGISGRLGRLLARRLHKQFRIIGIDRRGARHLPRDVVVHDLDIRRRACEDIFRRERIDAVVHLNIQHDPRRPASERHAFNVMGTHKLLDYCTRYGVTQFILLSSANVYGASPNNQQFLNEEAPLSAAGSFTSARVPRVREIGASLSVRFARAASKAAAVLHTDVPASISAWTSACAVRVQVALRTRGAAGHLAAREAGQRRAHQLQPREGEHLDDAPPPVMSKTAPPPLFGYI